MSFDFTLNGGEDIVDKLKNASSEMKSAVKRGLREGMERVVRDARMNYPYPDDHEAGNIRAEVTERGGAIEGRAVAPFFYATYVEMGTGPKGEKSHAGVSPKTLSQVTYRPNGWSYEDDKGWHHTEGQPARPFLYPAYKANKADIKKAVRKSIKDAMSGGG